MDLQTDGFPSPVPPFGIPHMKLTARSAALCSVTFAGLLALSACGKSEQSANQPASPSTAAAPAAPSTAAKPAPASTAAPAPAHTAAAPAAASTAAAAPAAPAAAPAAAENTFQVATVTLGDAVTPDHKVRKEVLSFSPSQKTIYVSVDTSGTTDGATLNAKWTYLEGTGQVIISTSQSITAEGPATTTFRIVNPNLWPEGKYKVDISLDGKEVATKQFDVKKS
jgi:pyruvate/2-oxoglutarate dehydrogenase complex dihydrolipoamide acyltransferase (E2) component